ncbi:MAG: hypothetical protein AAB372_04160, partial [Patescibacteria group bacterium]
RTKVIVERKKEEAQRPISLKGQIIEFDDEKGLIRIGDRVCKLPLHKHEHSLSRVVFRVGPHIPIQSADVYEEMSGNSIDKVRDKGKALKVVEDAVSRLNFRMKKEIGTKANLLARENKLITRIY